MANEWIRKDMSGGTVATTEVGAISNVALTITVADGSTYPDGSAGKFVICIDRALPTEEKILCTSRSGNVFTVSDRGYDGTAAVGHSNGAPVEHVIDAFSLEQALAYAAAAATTGSISYRSAAFAYAEIGVAGKTNLPLVAGASVPGYTALTLAGLATEVLNLLVPAGTVHATLGATADTGYFLIDGSSVVNAQSLYPALWNRIPASWKSGSTMVMPDWRGRCLVYDDAAAVFALGGSAGAMSKVIASGNLPLHTHDINHDHPNVTSTGESVGHIHNVNGSTGNDGPTHAHQAPPNAGTTAFIVNGTGDLGSANLTVGGAAYALNSVTGPPNALHQHAFNVNSQGNSVGHTHDVNLPALGVTASGNGGFANTALDVTPAVGVVNFQIKAH